MRLLPIAASLALAACTFQGGGIAPVEPAPARISEADLEVPYVPTPRPVVAAMLDLAEVGPQDYLIDLGSGDGRIAVMAALRGARSLGVDIDPNRVAEAVGAAQLAQVEQRARFRRQDLFDTPIAEASVIAMYLLPEINLRLRPRLLTEARPGTRIVSHNFTLGDWQPDAQRAIDASTIYLWIVPAVAGGSWTLTDPSGRVMALELDQRFQQVAGTASVDGRDFELSDVELSGSRLSFTIADAAGLRRLSGIVDGAEIRFDDGWIARRDDALGRSQQ